MLQYLGGVGADALEQAAALSDRLHVKPKSVCDSLLWHPAVDRTLDHPVFLDRGKPVDPLVVGVGLVVGGHEAFDLSDPYVLEHLDPQMAIEEEVSAPVFAVGRHDRCLDEPDGAHRGEDLGRSEEHTSELQSLMRSSYA